MSKEEKTTRILKAILWIVLGLDTIFGIVCLLMRKLISVGDMGIWIGSIGSIAAFFAVIYTTQKQLKEQRKSLKKQIKAQRENLVEQILHQTKDMHRPFLICKNDCNYVLDREDYEFRIYPFQEVFNNRNDTVAQPEKIRIVNKGRGLAKDIVFLNIDNRTQEIAKSLQTNIIEIDENNSIVINLSLNDSTYNDGKEFYIIIIYSDINGFLYTSILWIKMNTTMVLEQYDILRDKYHRILSKLILDDALIKDKYYEALQENN